MMSHDSKMSRLRRLQGDRMRARAGSIPMFPHATLRGGSYHMVVPSHAHTFLWFAPTPADRATHERGEAPSSLAVETSQSSAGSPPMETSSDHRKLRTKRTQRPIRQGLARRVLRLTTKRVLKRMWAGVSPLPVQMWQG